MKTLTIFLSKLNKQSEGRFNASEEHGPLYEVIENELVSDCEFSDLRVSGSLFSLTTFRNVVFKSCVFFGSKLENCTFINCTFEDCKFEFSNISFCSFDATIIENCSWEYSPCKKSELTNCTLGDKSLFFLMNEDNKLISCKSSSVSKRTLPTVPEVLNKRNQEIAA